MYPLTNQEMARQHREQLLREAAAERTLTSMKQDKNGSKFRKRQGFLQPAYDSTTILYGRPVVLQRVYCDSLALDEIRRDLYVTLGAMHKAGPENEDQLVDLFMQKLGSKLPPTGELLVAKPIMPHRRLLLSVAFLCVLMPLLGLLLGIGQGILIGVSLLCLAFVVLSLAL